MINQRRSTYPDREPVQTTGATSHFAHELLNTLLVCWLRYATGRALVRFANPEKLWQTTLPMIDP